MLILDATFTISHLKNEYNCLRLFSCNKQRIYDVFATKSFFYTLKEKKI